MQSRHNARLAALEKLGRTASTGQGQRIERYTVDGEEYVQVYWGDKPMCRPMHAWMWDCWPDATATGQP